MESPSLTAAEAGAEREPSPEAPLTAEQGGCARTPLGLSTQSTSIGGIRGRCFPAGTGCAQPGSPAQASEGMGSACSSCTSTLRPGPPCAAPSQKPQWFGIPMVPERCLCCSAPCDARASRHPLLGSGKGYPKCATGLFFSIPPSAVQGQAACGQVWQLPGLGSRAHKCLRF